MSLLSIGVATAAAAYHSFVSPAVRADAAHKQLEEAKNIHKDTSELVPELSEAHQQDFKDLQDQKEALFE